MNKTVLALGYIPKGKGGKQETGLATGIFDLHNEVNKHNSSYKVIIAATDIHQSEIIIDNTKVIGWNNNLLINHALTHPIRLLFFVLKTIQLFKFWSITPFFSTIAKLLFLDYSIKITKPDILHFHGTSGALYSYCLWKKKQKIILRIHGINGSNPTIPFFKKHRKVEQFITHLNYDFVTFLTNGNMNEWRKQYGTFNCAASVVVNGYNPIVFFPTLKNNIPIKYDLITIAGFSDNKGQMRIIKALASLKREGITLSYLSIGKITKEQKVEAERIIKEEKLNVFIKNYVPQEQLINYLHSSKYFILPSVAEGFGKVFIESIGAGIPVIIPKQLPLAKESNVLSSKNSILIEDSSIESIARGLIEISKNKKLYGHIEVSRTVKLLQWNIIAKDYLRIYKSIF